MILSVTGHRPDKLGGYSPEAAGILFDTAIIVLKKYPNITQVISGMALGWDTAIAKAAINMGIPFVAAVPFKEQPSKWPEASQVLYFSLLSLAKEVRYVSESGYSAAKMQIRNEWMVDQADKVAALWNGSIGGTMNCVNYAHKVGKPVDQYWDLFTSIKHRYA